MPRIIRNRRVIAALVSLQPQESGWVKAAVPLALLVLASASVSRDAEAAGKCYDGTWAFNDTVGWYCPEVYCEGEKKTEQGACCGTEIKCKPN